MTATAVVLALGVAALPAAAADQPEAPVSVWGKKEQKLERPQVQSGVNRAPATEPSAKPSGERAAWLDAEWERTDRARDTAGAAALARKQNKAAPKAAPSVETAESGGVVPLVWVPRGQGDVPWHRIADTRLTDALVARVDYSTGNLMLAGTDFDIAGVGQKLQLARTYNSLDAPAGAMAQRAWFTYERSLDTFFTDEVEWYDSTGATVSFKKKSDGSFTTPDGYSRDLVKNSDGTYTLTDRKSGTKDTYTSSGALSKVTDRNGGVITVASHGEGAGFKVTESRSGRWVDVTNDGGGWWHATDHTGRQVSYHLDDQDRVHKVTDTNLATVTYDYDSSDRIEQVTTQENRVTRFTYDSANRVTSMTRASTEGGSTGPTWTYAYSASSATAAGTTTVTDPEGDATKYVHNGDGEISKVTDPLTHSRSTTYQAHMATTAVDAMGSGSTAGNTTTYGWDARNNPTSAALPSGATAQMTGWLTKAGMDVPGTLDSPDDSKTNYSYDAVGNTTSVAVTGTGGGTTTTDYNPSTPTCGGFKGQKCSVTDARGKKTSFTYDAKGNLTKVTPPAPQGATTITYDYAGRPDVVKDGRGIQTVYVYDDRDRVTKVSSTNATVQYAYDDDGNMTWRKDATGETDYAYDTLSREIFRSLQDDSEATLAYTAAGDLDTYTDPMGATHYTYDDAGRLESLKDPAGRTTTYTYNNNDKRTHTNYPGGTVQKVTLDEDGKPTAIKTTNGSATLVDLAYTYTTGAGDPGTKIYSRTDAAAGRKTVYTYDSAGRLSYAKETNTSSGARTASWLYCFDKAGNLTHQDTTATSCPTTLTYGYDDASELESKSGSTTGWTYDKAGNETSAAPAGGTARTGESWSDYNQLTSITAGGTAYQAKHAGTTNDERTKLGDTWFHHTQLGLASTTTGSTDTGFVREPGGTLNSMTRSGKSYYYLTDATGNILGAVDQAGTRTHTYAYTPTGTTRTTPTETVPQPYRFAGAYNDSTGLYKMGARYYDPTLGRFTQPDPSGQETNTYLYATGDPINHTDPSGLFSVGDALGVAGDAITGVQHLADGDTKALWGDVLGVVAGGVAGTICESAAAASAPATLGTSLSASLGCYAIGWSVGSIASNAVS
ncbi:RHS repeat-associated core domain-containing protein [Streptomyces drozdowiczii]